MPPTVLITGAANGIGRATAGSSRSGARVFAVDRDESGVEELVSAPRVDGLGALVLRIDILEEIVGDITDEYDEENLSTPSAACCSNTDDTRATPKPSRPVIPDATRTRNPCRNAVPPGNLGMSEPFWAPGCRGGRRVACREVRDVVADGEAAASPQGMDSAPVAAQFRVLALKLRGGHRARALEGTASSRHTRGARHQ